jgi:hypothetical protein
MRVAELSVRRLLLEDEELYSNQGPPVLFYAESGDPWKPDGKQQVGGGCSVLAVIKRAHGWACLVLVCLMHQTTLAECFMRF